MIGIVETITPIKVLKEGMTTKNKPYTFYGARLTIDGVEYSATAFSKTELEEILQPISLRDRIEFSFTEIDGYKNLDTKNLIKVLKRAVPASKESIVPVLNGAPKTANQPKQISETEYRAELIRVMKECFEDTIKILGEDVPYAQGKDLAIALFEKRARPQYYATGGR